MAGNGPPPKHPSQRRRTNPTLAMTQLPAEGRQGDVPGWPLIPDVVMTARRDLAEDRVQDAEYKLGELRAEGKPCGAAELKLDRCQEQLLILERQLAAQRDLEAVLWQDLWRLPQAVQWERLGWLRDVAQYVRHKVLGELGELDSAKEARLWSDRLGLNPQALLRLRWEVVADELDEARQAKTTTMRTRPRLTAVE